jgi:ATP phosphoribosyltransferase
MSRIKIAIQKSGRLSEKSLKLLSDCGLELESSKNRLISKCDNFPLDVMLLRDDDIPEYVYDGICDLGIVGENVLKEKIISRPDIKKDCVEVVKELGFGKCRLAIAFPQDLPYTGIQELNEKRIATSYPVITSAFLREMGVKCEIVHISGSVEIAPTLKIADAICDLVSTGTTLRTHGLKEVETVLLSQSVLIKTKVKISDKKSHYINLLSQRVNGVMNAARTKYVTMNAPKESLEMIKQILPGMEEPSVIPLSNDNTKIAIHAVCRENVFWETMEKLKKAGASSILVMPIEKIID